MQSVDKVEIQEILKSVNDIVKDQAIIKSTIIKSLPDEIENLDLCENDFSGDVEGLANALCGKKIKKLNLAFILSF